MAVSMIIRYRCFECGYAYYQFVYAKVVHEIFRKGRHDEDGNGFPQCPSCRKSVQLVSYEEVKQK